MKKRIKPGVGTRYDDPVVRAMIESDRLSGALSVSAPNAGKSSVCHICGKRKSTVGGNRKSGRFVCASCLGVK